MMIKIQLIGIQMHSPKVSGSTSNLSAAGAYENLPAMTSIWCEPSSM